ncbi:ATP-grasp domain-containing protein [Metabacillus fastidiosus]|uniref:ATP-grasp domain-containing protein n=1 Tax=Metabacillus fastidiosus TaxID=1458 RepID=UPI003D26BC5C
MVNILITSAGRRVELVQQFIKARNSKKLSGRIICADMSDLAPALYFADISYSIPKISDPMYISKLLEICQKEEVDIVIPTIDTELSILSDSVKLFQTIGTDVLISSKETIKITENKMETFKFFKSIDINTPDSVGKEMKYEGEYPCFIKPVSGSSSVNVFKVKNEQELKFFKYYIGDYIIQKFVDGDEFTIDVFCDFEGNPIYITPRIRISTRSGEVNKTKIYYDQHLMDSVFEILKALKPKGPLTIQTIKDNVDGRYYFIEINARFGGGSPLSMMAGANSAEALYDLINGKKFTYESYAAKKELMFVRFDQSIALEREINGQYEKIKSSHI